jgi:hypothetical protein
LAQKGSAKLFMRKAYQMPNKLTVPGGSIRDIELPSLLIYIPMHRKLF